MVFFCSRLSDFKMLLASNPGSHVSHTASFLHWSGFFNFCCQSSVPSERVLIVRFVISSGVLAYVRGVSRIKVITKAYPS